MSSEFNMPSKKQKLNLMAQGQAAFKRSEDCSTVPETELWPREYWLCGWWKAYYSSKQFAMENE